MFSFLFIATLVLVSGLVAMVGDRLGSHIGRKRRSLWGLRPRHTAMLVTVATGMVITVLTLGAMLMVSKQARVAFFGVEKLGRELVSLNRQIKSRNIQLADLRGRLSRVNTVYSLKERALRRRLEATTANLHRKEADQKRLQASISSMKEDYTAAAFRLSRAEKDVADLRHSKTALNREIDQLRTSVVDFRELARKIGQVAIVKERGHVIFRADQNIEVGMIPGRFNPTKRRAALMSLISRADETAVRLGAKGASVRAAAGKRMLSGTAVYWSKDHMENVEKTLSQTADDTVVMLSSFTNTVLGEPVLIIFRLMKNNLIFRNGEEILRADIDGSKSQEAIGEDIIGLLRRVREKALVKGVLSDPDEGTVGSVSAFRILDTIRSIKEAGGRSELLIKAGYDTWTSGPLIIDFVIKGKE